MIHPFRCCCLFNSTRLSYNNFQFPRSVLDDFSWSHSKALSACITIRYEAIWCSLPSSEERHRKSNARDYRSSMCAVVFKEVDHSLNFKSHSTHTTRPSFRDVEKRDFGKTVSLFPNEQFLVCNVHTQCINPILEFGHIQL